MVVDHSESLGPGGIGTGPVRAQKTPWMIGVVAVAMLMILSASAASAHYDYGFNVVGPNSCELEWASNHSSTQYSAETIESDRSAAQPGCSGVSGRVRYSIGAGDWTTHYGSDTTPPYDVFLNGSHVNGVDYSDHNGRDYYNSIWYGFRVDH